MTDDNSASVELWKDSYDLILIHNAKLPRSSNSGIFRKGYSNI